MKKIALLILCVMVYGTNYSQTLYAPGGVISSSSVGSYSGVGTPTSLDNAALTIKGIPSAPWKQLALDGSTDDWFLGSFGGGGFFIAKDNFASVNVKFTIVGDNVGIGTTTPSYKLSVKSADGKHLKLENGTEAGFVGLSSDGNLNIWAHGDDDIIFSKGTGAGVESMRINYIGNVGIGTTNPAHKLDVMGTIHATEVIVDLNVEGPDYVFEEGYDLQNLSELAEYLKTNKHLPEVPSAAQMKEKGVNMVEMQMLLLKKVEELTLYIIDVKEENNTYKNDIELLRKENYEQDKSIQQLLNKLQE
jgi:hypothetical protein